MSDWEIGEDARLERIHRAWEFVPLNLYDEITKLAENALGEYIAEVARLREREAQLERERDYLQSRLPDFSAVQQADFARAEAAEVRVQELERELAFLQIQSTDRLTELEAALREIASPMVHQIPGVSPDGFVTSHTMAQEIARRALEPRER